MAFLFLFSFLFRFFLLHFFFFSFFYLKPSKLGDLNETDFSPLSSVLYCCIFPLSLFLFSFAFPSVLPSFFLLFLCPFSFFFLFFFVISPQYCQIQQPSKLRDLNGTMDQPLNPLIKLSPFRYFLVYKYRQVKLTVQLKDQPSNL